MPYIVLGVAVVLGLFLVFRGIAGTDPKVALRILKWSGIVVGSGLFIYLTLTGRLSAALWIAAATLPFVMRWRAVRRMARNWRGPTPGQTSDIETRYLRMQLDHDTGVLKGTILEGRFRGRLLEELDQQDLMLLLQECRVDDEQSATILETYLDRVYGAEWRGGDSGTRGGGAPAGSSMTLEEAYEILGLQPGAKAEEIREAHRRLMQKNHPDHGGSTYLAAKINQAKDLLLSI